MLIRRPRHYRMFFQNSYRSLCLFSSLFLCLREVGGVWQLWLFQFGTRLWTLTNTLSKYGTITTMRAALIYVITLVCMRNGMALRRCALGSLIVRVITSAYLKWCTAVRHANQTHCSPIALPKLLFGFYLRCVITVVRKGVY